MQPAHMHMQAQSAPAQAQALAFSWPSVASNFLPTPFLVMSMSAQREWRGKLLVSSRLMAWLLCWRPRPRAPRKATRKRQSSLNTMSVTVSTPTAEESLQYSRAFALYSLLQKDGKLDQEVRDLSLSDQTDVRTTHLSTFSAAAGTEDRRQEVWRRERLGPLRCLNVLTCRHVSVDLNCHHLLAGASLSTAG